MMASIVVLSTQMCNTKMRSSKLINKSDVRKQIVKFGFGCEFHDLNYFELYLFIKMIYFSIFFEFIIHLRSSSNIFVQNRHFNVIL